MYYALVYYPKIESHLFHDLRQTFEPFASLMPEHVPLIFPVSESIGLNNLINHINRILKKWNQFEIHFCGLEKTWDHWLILMIKEGNRFIVQLHDIFYTGLLQPYLRKDLPFTPHLALGYFGYEKYDFDFPEKIQSLDEDKYNHAKMEFQKVGLDFWRKVNKLTLVKVNDDFSKCWNIKNFEINSTLTH